MLTDKYNIYTGKYERVPEDWVLRYDAFEGVYEFAPPNEREAQPTYNPMEGEYRLLSDGKAIYNPMKGRYEVGREGWAPSFNALAGEYTVAPTEEPDKPKKNEPEDPTAW